MGVWDVQARELGEKEHSRTATRQGQSLSVDHQSMLENTRKFNCPQPCPFTSHLEDMDSSLPSPVRAVVRLVIDCGRMGAWHKPAPNRGGRQSGVIVSPNGQRLGLEAK